jgi:hypothetical protein
MTVMVVMARLVTASILASEAAGVSWAATSADPLDANERQEGQYRSSRQVGGSMLAHR